ncbi:sugar-binding transcriptional regulator [Aquipuribacter hungaricus]|uniref:Sugar-binding transcriptional regulator n=1 Tax=Aquipuribacter hungaricus TaxID=545624 RepID=A0ABV7WK12_9MICO
MTAQPVAGHAKTVLAASIARRYYIDGRSKSEIADEFRISRFKVARLLDDSRASGLVRIEIGHPGATVAVGLSAELQDAFSLTHAIVVDTPDEHPGALMQKVGRAAAELLEEIVTPDDVLGLGWARSLLAMNSALTQLAPCAVVQLTGALSRPDVDDSSIDLVRDVARLGGGTAYYYHYPMIVPDAQTATVLRAQPEVARAFEQFRSVTKAVVGLGSWEPPYSTVYDALSEQERQELRALGVRADVSGVLLDGDGAEVDAPLAQRMICVRHADLRAVPEVIGVVYGTEKVEAAQAAVRGGCVDSIVTHSSVARALLARA